MNEIRYRIINVALLLFTMFVITDLAKRVEDMFMLAPVGLITVIVSTALLVHGLKAFRFYFELYEKKMPFNLFLRQYCKVIPVSMIFPFKLGDFFRMYCFGHHLRDNMAGVAVVLFDRFVDTIALVTVIVAIHIFFTVEINRILFLLCFVLCLLVAMYRVCPGMCIYWKRYLLVQEATQGKMRLLRLFSALQQEYAEIQAVVNGKFMLTYLLSLLAWVIEIGSLFLMCHKYLSLNSIKVMQDYITGAMKGASSEYLLAFICVSSVILFCIFVILKAVSLIRKGVGHE